jgi:hypothetical protein
VIHHCERKWPVADGARHVGDGRVDEWQRPDFLLDLSKRSIVGASARLWFERSKNGEREKEAGETGAC